MPGALRPVFAEGTDSASVIAGKVSGLIIHNAKRGVMETPPTLLREHKHAAKEIRYSRVHFPHEGESAWYATITAPDFNDGTAPITRVEVSSDGVATWVDATIEPAESPWAWYHWSAKGKLKAGQNVLISRATDAIGRTQPLDGLV